MGAEVFDVQYRLHKKSVFRVSGLKQKMVIARAKPVAIYDFPLFLILNPESSIPNLKRILPRFARNDAFL
jgi:hypothetical protein